MNIEPLEARIAPAATFTYIDVDGDVVTITTSKGTNAELTEANGVLTFSLPDAGAPDVPRQLLKIDLSIGGENIFLFEGTDLSVKVTRKAAGGDGLAHVGFIDAVDQEPGASEVSKSLGKVTIGGDLGQIEAGVNVDSIVAVKSLNVQSLGLYGLATQGGTGDLMSVIQGPLGSLTVRGDVREAGVMVSSQNEEGGTIGPVTIGGSLIGGDGPGTGVISASGNIGPVKIRGDVHGGDGGLVASSGAISAGGTLASVTIGGSVFGRNNLRDGAIVAASFLGPVKIGGTFSGLLGASVGGGVLPSLIVGGSLFGDVRQIDQIGMIRVAGDFIGEIVGDSITSVRVAGDFIGEIEGKSITSVTIGGSVFGGTITGSFFGLGAVKIGGDLIGGTISAGVENPVGLSSTLGSVTIGGSFIGDGTAGHIFGGNIGAVRIGGSVIGDGEGSATIRSFFADGTASTSSILSVTIGRSLIGGSGAGSAQIEAGRGVGIVNPSGDLGAVKIGRDLRGGTADFSGQINAGSIKSVSIGGSLIGGIRDFTGAIVSAGDIGPVKIGRDLQGGSMAGSATPSFNASGFIRGDRIASLTIGGSILAGIDTSAAGNLLGNAAIRANDDIGAIKVKGSIVGTSHAEGITRPLISARGQETLAPGATTDLAIKSLTVGGRVDLALILAGFDSDDPVTAGSNGDASIGPVRIGRDWIASSISAGVNDTNGNGFGNDDQRILGATLVSRIASISIKGAVIGTAAIGDHFGFTAEQIGAFKSLGFTAKFTLLTDSAIPLALVTGDVAIREI